VLDPDQIGNWRRYAKLHTQLYPYLAQALATYRKTGMPVMRQLGLVYPRDSQANAADDEFLVGDDLLAAPVLDQGATTRALYLPHGKWVDLWRSAVYRPGPGEIDLRKARLLRGRRSVTVPAPIDQLPLMVRAGAVIPMLPAAVDTLAPYGKGVTGVDSLADARHRLRVLAFPRKPTIDVPGHPRKVKLEATLATLQQPFVPCAITVDGKTVDRDDWSFDRRTGVLNARFAFRHGPVRVRPCL
jgi:hypothetical protein